MAVQLFVQVYCAYRYGKNKNRFKIFFDNTGAVIESKQSKNAKYTSLSITVNLKNPDAVIGKYKEVGR